MKRTALLIPCLMALIGCQREEAQPPATPAPPVTAAPAAPVAESVPAPPPQGGSAMTPQVEQPAVEKKLAPAEAEQPAAVPVAAAPTAGAPLSAAAPQPAVSEAEALALAKKHCFTCHQVDRKVLGPSWKDVANKYRGDATAQGRLENVIAKGGKGAWGTLAMPALPQVSEADRRLLVRYILNLK